MYEKVGNVCWKFLIHLVNETKLGMAQTLFDPDKKIPHKTE